MNFTDTLLNDRNFSIPELEREQEAMQQKIAEMKRNYRQSAQTTSSPVWDEIDRIMDSLTEKEFRFMQENEEFQQSSMEIQSILNREYMKKTVKDEADKKDALMNEYITQYSDMSWNEFMDMKQRKTSSKSKK